MYLLLTHAVGNRKRSSLCQDEALGAGAPHTTESIQALGYGAHGDLVFQRPGWICAVTLQHPVARYQLHGLYRS